MFTQLLLSLFGIAVVHRILSLFEKSEVFEVKKLRYTFIFLQIPLTVNLFFKELSALVIIYIGFFFIILILSPKIFAIFHKNSFERMHLVLIQRLLLHISTGQSPKLSVQIVFDELSNFEKQTFSILHGILNANEDNLRAKSSLERFFYTELASILNSSSHILEQLRSFRRILSLQYNLRHKSRQTLLQTRVQAVVCGLIYVGLLVFSHIFLSFNLMSWPFYLSLSLQIMGLYLIFNTGKKIQWRT